MLKISIIYEYKTMQNKTNSIFDQSFYKNPNS